MEPTASWLANTGAAFHFIERDPRKPEPFDSHHVAIKLAQSLLTSRFSRSPSNLHAGKLVHLLINLQPPLISTPPRTTYMYFTLLINSRLRDLPPVMKIIDPSPMHAVCNGRRPPSCLDENSHLHHVLTSKANSLANTFRYTHIGLLVCQSQPGFELISLVDTPCACRTPRTCYCPLATSCMANFLRRLLLSED